MKAVLPVAGVGTRLRPLTVSLPKVLVPVAGRALIDWILLELLAEGLQEAVFIVGYRAELVQEHLERTWPELRCTFVRQEEMLGLGHAVSLGLSEDDEEVFIILGDTLFTADIAGIRARPHNVLGVKTVEDPRRFGVAETRGERITRLVEKPENPTSNLALVGLYNIKQGGVLKESLERMIREGRRTRGEFQITDALQERIEAGDPYDAVEIGDWFDCGKKETLLATNRHFLATRTCPVEAPRLENSLVLPPVSIGPGVVLRDSVVGPDVSLGANCVIENSRIRDSILASGCHVTHTSLEQSVFGEGANSELRPRVLDLGDHSRLGPE